MYLQNKYTKYYFNIIQKAKLRVLDKTEYTEKHHIVPRCLGGDNSSNNLANLTAREHFICHWLLTKMTTGKDKSKMNSALWMMSTVQNKNHKRYKLNSKLYEIIRIQTAKESSKNLSGKKLSQETKEKISKTRKEKFISKELEIKVYNSTREKHSKAKIGYKHSIDTKHKIGQAHKGKAISDSQKEYLSSLYKGKPRIDETIKEKISKTTKLQYDSGLRKPVAGMKGKHMPESAKEKISNTHKGKPKSNEHRKKISEQFKGKTWKLVNGKRCWFDKKENTNVS